MKRTAKTKNTPKDDPESELRETVRQFARNVLNTPKLRETAAKKIGSQPSYIRAMLDQRGVGGLGSWVALMDHCFDICGLDFQSLVSRVLRDPELIKKASAQSPSEIVFRNLDQISIVNEDVKFQLASNLEKMLKDLEKSLEGRSKR